MLQPTPSLSTAQYYEGQLRQKDIENQQLREEIQRLSAQISVFRSTTSTSVINPFSYSFDEYIRHCPVNALKLQEKLFSQKLKGKIVQWLVQVGKTWGDNTQLYILPQNQASNHVIYIHHTQFTKTPDFVEGKQTWIIAKIIRLSSNMKELQLEAVQRIRENEPDLSITYSKLNEIFNPEAQNIADAYYTSWSNVQFSFIAKIKMLTELKEEPNYSTMMQLTIIQPFHDNEIEPIVLFFKKDKDQDIKAIIEHKDSIFEFTATPLQRIDKQHYLEFILINQILSNSFRPQLLPINMLQSSEQIQLLRNSMTPPPQQQSQQLMMGQTLNLQNMQISSSVQTPQPPQIQSLFNPMFQSSQFVNSSPMFQSNQFGSQGMIQSPLVSQSQQVPQTYQSNILSYTQVKPPQQNQPQSPSNSSLLIKGNSPPPLPNNKRAQFSTVLPSHKVEMPKLPQLTEKEEKQKHYLCDLTNKVMNDPVSIKGDGNHYYERAELLSQMQDNGGYAPLTMKNITVNDIRDEPKLKAEIQLYLRDNPQRKADK